MTARKHESGVRKYTKNTLWGRCRQWWQCRRLGHCGQQVLIEPNVKFWRHPEHISLGNRVIIKEGARLCPANEQAHIHIGDWTTIGYHTFMFASAGITIGANCLIAPFCYFVDTNHGLAREELIREQAMSASSIAVEEDVWLGVRCTVLKGVTIGRGAVVAAGSVVANDIPPYAIARGNPAEILGQRREKTNV